MNPYNRFSNLPFIIPLEFYVEASQACFRNYEKRNISESYDVKTAKHHQFLFIPDDSGIGKTRAGEEIANIPVDILSSVCQGDQDFISAMRDPIYCYVNLNNSSGHSLCEYIDKKEREYRMGARIALSQDPTCNNLLDIVKKYDNFDFDRVIHSLLINKPNKTNVTSIIIHIDNHQHFIDSIQTKFGETLEYAKHSFKQMIGVIGGHMLGNTSDNHFIVPVLTGTCDNDVRFAMAENWTKTINLDPLDPTKVNQLVDHYLKVNNRQLLDQPHFQIAIGETGFIPSILIDLLKSANNNQLPLGYQESTYQLYVDKWNLVMQNLGKNLIQK
ncbi:hypothetical protein DFA_01145 [Cavenderia fasciculata]|uniref:Uncharacterized protein n=1 Tax=Cavenderia fasciculata TaxID=261658 RepID=F4PR66_CACFS|nr:uncharacterized protein DFA_01145 [Cavenderia fasciculata]EGG21266.1 hypothetical protein DFA_01145 [Cavenderia fasciculata]|eukprot:XP_004359116.1 hypothetical protein DFA_01145 [Cavenderia fasciculata]